MSPTGSVRAATTPTSTTPDADPIRTRPIDDARKDEDLVGPTLTVHAFPVRHLLPIWFDVQCLEWPDARMPEPCRRYA